MFTNSKFYLKEKRVYICNTNPICGNIPIDSIQNALRLFMFLWTSSVLLRWAGTVQAVALLNGTIDLSKAAQSPVCGSP